MFDDLGQSLLFCLIVSDDNLLTTAQVALKTGYAVRTIYNLVSAGKIPYKKLSKRAIRFDPKEIERWIEEQNLKVKQEEGAA